jgi:hypothetical protein
MTGADELTTADRLALRALVDQYARAADTRDDARFADVFTDDGVLVTTRGEIRGRSDLLTVAGRLARYGATMHLVANHVVSSSAPGAASGVTYCQASHVRAVDGVDRVFVMQIVYHDDFVRVDGGPRPGWRVAVRRLEVLWEEDRPLTV